MQLLYLSVQHVPKMVLHVIAVVEVSSWKATFAPTALRLSLTVTTAPKTEQHVTSVPLGTTLQITHAQLAHLRSLIATHVLKMALLVPPVQWDTMGIAVYHAVHQCLSVSRALMERLVVIVTKAGS